MKIAIIQTNLVWENPEANRKHFEQKINTINENVDLIVLPEMFTTGFTTNAEKVAEKMNGKTIDWLQKLARQKNCAITGSLIIEENNYYFNRSVFVVPTREIQTYDKRHLFTFGEEHKHFTAGEDKLIVEYKGWKICPLICYDLRFPVFARNVENYDLLLYVANWPITRINAWDSLLKARAIENVSYAIGVNRIGTDAKNLTYNGHSQVIDYMGNYRVEPQENEGVFIVTLDKKTMLEARNNFGFLNDKDHFELI
jgi:omega-amidase